MGKQVKDWTPPEDATMVISTDDEWSPPKDAVLKKKEPTVNAVSSKGGTDNHGFVESSDQPKAQETPSYVPITGSSVDPFGIGEIIAKTVYSGFAHQIPAAIASIPGLNNQSYEDYLLNKENSTKKRGIAGKLFTESLSNFDIKKAFTIGEDEIKNRYLSDLKKEIGENKFNKNKQVYEEGLIAKTLAGRKVFEENMAKRQTLLGGSPESYTTIKNPKEAAQYLAYQFGQALPTMGAAIVAPGLGSYVLEATDSYNESVDEIAKVSNKTPEEVIEQGLDAPAKEIASNVGLINAALDFGGIGTVANTVRKIFTKEAAKNIAKRSLSSQLVKALKNPLFVEPLTETIQEFNTAFQSQKAAGKTNTEALELVKENYPRLLDAFVGGLTGAGAVTMVSSAMSPSQVISSEKSTVKDTSDLGNVTTVADVIQDKINQVPDVIEGIEDKFKPKEEVTNDSQNQSRIPSEERIGQEPVQANVEQSPSTQEASSGGVVQGTSQEKVNDTSGLEQVQVPDFKIGDQDIFYHATSKGFKGKLQENQAPQFGTGIYLSTNKNLVKEEFGKNVHEVKLNISNPVYTNTDEWHEVEKLALEKSNKNKKGNENRENDDYDLAEINSKHISDAAKELGHDAIIDKGSSTYDNEIVVLDENKIIYTNETPSERTGPGANPIPETAPQAVISSQTQDIQSTPEEKNPKPSGVSPTVATETGGQPIGENQESTAISQSGTNDQGAGGINTPPDTRTQPGASNEAGRQYAVLKRIEESSHNEAIKRGVKENGDNYIPKGIKVTESEAEDLLDLYGPDKAETVIRDPSNGITPDTRVVLSAKLYQHYKNSAQNEKAVNIAMWAADYEMQAGRASNAGKYWKMITQDGEDQIVLAIENQYHKGVESTLAPIRQEVNKAREEFDAEIRRLVEEKVAEQVGARLEKAKLISKEKRKEISDFFDNLKVKPGNIATAIFLPIGVLPHVWNASVDIIKTAILTGADVANAIQSGIDYIKANQKEAFDEDQIRKLEPQLQALMPRKKIKTEDIKSEKIKTPKISIKKKKDFISQAVDLYNEGKLTDAAFDKLYASKLGYKDLTDQDRAKVREMAKIISDAEKFAKETKENFTQENIKKYESLLRDAQKANTLLQYYSQKESNIWDTLVSIMQGNTLAPLSLISNIFYNVTLQQLRFMSAGIASILDYSESKLAKIGMLPKAMKERTINMKALQKGYFSGAWVGATEGTYQLLHGQQAEERNLREIHSNFNPVRAISRWAEKDRTVKQKVNDYVEGTFGLPAEGMFRLLNMGDKPFKRAAEYARAFEIGALKGLKGKELQKFLMFPDDESAALIKAAGEEATFQQSGENITKLQNFISDFLKRISKIPIIGGPAKLILKSQALYIKTPLNYISEALQFSIPPLTLAAGLYNVATGKKRVGNILIAKSLVGSMLAYTAASLFAKGILSGDDDKDKQKEREMQGAETPVPPPNSVNMSALQRGLLNGDWSIKDGDKWVSTQKMAITGLVFQNYANIFKDRISKGEPMQSPDFGYVSDMFASAPRIMGTALDQTFLQGANSAIEAVKDGGDRKTQKWAIQTIGTLTNIAYPNTLSAISKASDTYNRDIEDVDFAQKLANTYKTKFFAGESLPSKVNLWGEKVTGHPEGKNKYVYFLFDPLRFKDIDTDDYRYKLYEAWKGDYDAKWLPSIVSRTMQFDKEAVKLTPSEHEELAIDVGKERASMAFAYINSPQWETDSTEERKKELSLIYDEGYAMGKERWQMDNNKSGKFKFRTPDQIKSIQNKMREMSKSVKP